MESDRVSHNLRTRIEWLTDARFYSLVFFVCLLQILQNGLGPPCLQLPLLQPIVSQFVHLI
jgi:hypothetical protein